MCCGIKVIKNMLGIFSKCPENIGWHMKMIKRNHFLCHFIVTSHSFSASFYPARHDTPEEVRRLLLILPAEPCHAALA